MIVVISKISLNKLIDGGAAIFAAVKINHHRVKVGPTHIKPLVKNILRVFVISYDRFAKINNAEDLKPWATIIAKDPDIPHKELESSPASINPMWPTEEYAINDLRSGWRIQINLVITAPHRERLISIEDPHILILGNINTMRAKP